MMNKQHIEIWVFDTNPIHLCAFNLHISNDRRIRLRSFRSANDMEWKNLLPPALSIINMDSAHYCTRLLLQSIISSVPDIPIACYSSGRRNIPQVVHEGCDRIVVLSFEGIISYLQEFTGLAGDRIPLQEQMLGIECKEYTDLINLVRALTPRELDIFCLIGKGNGTLEIADLFDCSTSTVETHIKNVKNKLRLANLPAMRQLAIEYINSGSCHATSLQPGHICPERNKTVGSCPHKRSI
jgi:DNA-binding CsgD family transcriptional regulator